MGHYTGYIDYARDVQSGDIVCCQFIKQAVNRFFRFLEHYRFDYEKVDRVISLVRIMRHYTGRHAGKRFILTPWQEFVVANIFGFYREDGTRLIRSVYIEMARKQGKSALAAALCLYGLIGDGEANAEVYLAANSKDQAKIAFQMCSAFAKGMDPKHQFLVPFRDTIKYSRTMSLLRVLASDDSKLDGFNASMYLLDEFHAAKNTRLKDVLQSSQGMRENPLAVIITTAGFDKLGPCYEYRTMCTEVLGGIKEDDTLFAAIYTLDEGDDWKDPRVWIKSNPNLGVTVKSSYIKEQVTKATNSPADEVGVKTKNINIWCDAENVWIPEHYLLESSKHVLINDMKGCDTYVGIDLSSTSDLTSISFMFPFYQKYYFLTKYYLPEAALKEKRFKELYGEWRREKLITITPGNVVDYDYILNDILDAAKTVRLMNIGYDQWNATQFVINATDKGLPMEAISQSIGNFNKPTKELERLILSGEAIIDTNKINRHCYRNVVLSRDKNGNIKPSKQFEEKKIDGVISQLMALSAYLNSPRYGQFY